MGAQATNCPACGMSSDTGGMCYGCIQRDLHAAKLGLTREEMDRRIAEMEKTRAAKNRAAGDRGDLPF